MKWLIVLLASTVWVCDATLAGSDELPDGAWIADKADAAQGDPQKIRSIRNVVCKGILDMKVMKGTFTETAARPMKALTVNEFPGMGQTRSGTDGEVFWEDNGPLGVAIHEGNPKLLRMHGYAARLHIPWREIYESVECVGVKKMEERDCYKLAFEPEGGLTEYVYIDKETFLTFKVELTLVEPTMGGQKLPIEIIYRDWKEVDGIQYAHIHEIGVNRMQVTMKYETFEHDVDLPDGLFDLPDSVKKKLAEKAR